MAIRKIIFKGNDMLRKKSRPVQYFDKRLAALLDDMHETLVKADGAGLAAVQVGLLKRVVVIHYEDNIYELVNPEIIEKKGEQTGNEACLSCPGTYGVVTRPAYVKVKAYSRDRKPFTLKADDLFARIICHELDHLDGILYTDLTDEIHFNEK
ncbi:MAG: peptide deformylase [Oscillospiraceae bacterium]|nr:peptide deformylase [Oscillospiraceae bacterium]